MYFENVLSNRWKHFNENVIVDPQLLALYKTSATVRCTLLIMTFNISKKTSQHKNLCILY